MAAGQARLSWLLSISAMLLAIVSIVINIWI